MVAEPKQGAPNSAENKLYALFEEKIDAFVKKKQNGYKPSAFLQNKVIHDPVWGTMLFYPWELQVLDSPLLQRLRNINQVGLSILTYPSAHHSRFEHTLGVMTVVTKMVDNINHTRNLSRTESRVIADDDLYKMRLAALLHDVGHCFFSHLSETIYGKLKPFVELKQSFEIFEDAKEHEIFAYIIVNCPTFKAFFTDGVKYPDKKEKSRDVDIFFADIGKMIVGAFLPYEKKGAISERKYYLTQIINGQFDADKLDYLRRDSYTAGLALTYDIERLLYKIRIEEQTENEHNSENVKIGKHLTMPVSGISAVEEMVFSQLMLTSYIYQHQKVLATDALVLDVVEGLARNKKMKDPWDFLEYCDEDIYKIYNEHQDQDFKTAISGKKISSSSHKTLSDIVKRVKNRELPKRALIINYSTVNQILDAAGHSLGKTKYKVSDLAFQLKQLSQVRQEICNEAIKISDLLDESEGGKRTIDYYDIHIVIPKTSVAKDLANAFVLSNENQLVKLSEVVRLNDWADAFSFHKWNAYIFARADIVPVVSIAGKVVFERYGIRFDDEKVFSNLKEKEEIDALVQILKEKYSYSFGTP